MIFCQKTFSKSRMFIFVFFFLDQKYSCPINFVQQFKTVSLSWNLVPKLIQYAKFHCDVHLICSFTGNRLFRRLSSKMKYCSFKVKPGTLTNSNMQNSIVKFIFSVLNWKYPFWEDLIQQIKIVSSRWNLVLGLIKTHKIQWKFSLFLFSSGNILFEKIWYQNL